MNRRQTWLVVSLFVLVGGVGSASAQPTFESVGERALGMGGAFVAVADDATATYWNPAGLVAGRPVGMALGWYRRAAGNPDGPAFPGAERRSGTYTSLGTWPLGVSYGHFTASQLTAAVDGSLFVRTLHTSQAGVTILQSVVEGLIVGSTLKYVRGDAVAVPTEGDTVEQAFDRTEDVEGLRSGHFDLDVGVMVDMQQLRVGFTWKNLLTPTFGDVAANTITLPRQTRLGVAYMPNDGLTLAMDLDLETVDFLGQTDRMIAFGGEGRLSSRVAVRSGLRWSLE